MSTNYDCIIIGAGAAGMMCAIESGKRGRTTLVLDHAKAPGEKIRISGGGRCNFTNIYTTDKNFLSTNAHFCKSALKRFTHYDFIAMVQKHDIAFHEKTLGQQFCDHSAKNIIEMLLNECAAVDAKIQLHTRIIDVQKTSDTEFSLQTSQGQLTCQSLVIATGGLSIPKMGATGFGYQIATQFGLNLTECRAGLVPFTFTDDFKDFCKNMTGVAVDAVVSCGKQAFREGLLFTHRGLSGPSILQISSYWKEGLDIHVNLCPDNNLLEEFKKIRETHPKQKLAKTLCAFFPKRLAQSLCDFHQIDKKMAEMGNKEIAFIADNINNWCLRPNGTEGYRTAEVTLGGVDTDELSSKTFETKKVSGLYFIGEVIDVTGHLGGFNFQWAWASGFAAGQYC